MSTTRAENTTSDRGGKRDRVHCLLIDTSNGSTHSCRSLTGVAGTLKTLAVERGLLSPEDHFKANEMSPWLKAGRGCIPIMPEIHLRVFATDDELTLAVAKKDYYSNSLTYGEYLEILRGGTPAVGTPDTSRVPTPIAATTTTPPSITDEEALEVLRSPLRVPMKEKSSSGMTPAAQKLIDSFRPPVEFTMEVQTTKGPVMIEFSDMDGYLRTEKCGTKLVPITSDPSRLGVDLSNVRDPFFHYYSLHDIRAMIYAVNKAIDGVDLSTITFPPLPGPDDDEWVSFAVELSRDGVAMDQRDKAASATAVGTLNNSKVPTVDDDDIEEDEEEEFPPLDVDMIRVTPEDIILNDSDSTDEEIDRIFGIKKEPTVYDLYQLSDDPEERRAQLGAIPSDQLRGLTDADIELLFPF